MAERLRPWIFPLIFILLAGAGALSARAASPAWDVTWLEPDETRLRPRQLALTASAIHAIEQLEFSEPIALFGGNHGTDVILYLSERLRYLGVEDEKDTYASNFGPLWLDFAHKHRVLHEPSARPERVPFRDGTVAIRSPRTGYVALGQTFTAKGTSDIERMETLVHEARHSDCPAMPSRRDLEAYVQERFLEMSDKGRACTNVHMPCPRGHALAGELACDTHPWGAYMMGYTFANEIFKHCSNCTERQRQEALVTAKEDFTRLSRGLQQGIVRGTLPEPDLGSIE
jgi:hypothetical protein